MANRNCYKKYQFSTKCRICLTQSPTAVSLELPLNEKMAAGQKDGPLIYDVLEQVMSVKIKLAPAYPSNICGMCLGLLKIAYDLRKQFLDSQKILQKCLPTLDLNDIEEDPLKCEPEDRHVDKNKCNNTKSDDDINGCSKRVIAPVELLVGTNKYDISDVVIVENDISTDDTTKYKGFLNNLGKTISARIIKTNKNTVEGGFVRKRIAPEKPEVFIEKIVQKPKRLPLVTHSQPVVTRSQPRVTRSQPLVTRLHPEVQVPKVYVRDLEDVDKYIIENSQCVEKKELLASLRQAAIFEEDVFFGEDVKVSKLDQNYEAGDTNNRQEMKKAQIRSAMNLQFKCPYCHKLYCSKNRILNHLSVCVKAGGPLMCTICNKEFKNTKTMSAHMYNYHQQTLGKPKAREKYKCPECNLTFRTSSSFWYHKLKHRGKEHTCETCGRNFYTTGMLETHRNAAHGKDEIRVLCPVCGKGFHYKSGLFYHMKQHTNERKYLCELCDRKFYALNSLKRHSRTHTGDRPYGCTYCDKMFFSLGEAKKHELLHTGFRPFQCEQCGKGFTTAHNKKVHMVVHSGDLMCTYCERTFINVESLTYHLRNKHKITIEPLKGDGKHEHIMDFEERHRFAGQRRDGEDGQESTNEENDEDFADEEDDFFVQDPLQQEEVEKEQLSQRPCTEEDEDLVEMLIDDNGEIQNMRNIHNMEDIQGDVSNVVFVDMEDEEQGSIEFIEADGTHLRL